MSFMPTEGTKGEIPTETMISTLVGSLTENMAKMFGTNESMPECEI